MANLSGTYPVMFENEQAGRLTVRDDGMYVSFEMQSIIPTNEVFRLYCLCMGEYISIGVAMPGGKALRVNKNFSRNELRKMKLGSIEKCVLSVSMPKAENAEENKKAPAGGATYAVNKAEKSEQSDVLKLQAGERENSSEKESLAQDTKIAGENRLARERLDVPYGAKVVKSEDIQIGNPEKNMFLIPKEMRSAAAPENDTAPGAEIEAAVRNEKNIVSAEEQKPEEEIIIFSETEGSDLPVWEGVSTAEEAAKSDSGEWRRAGDKGTFLADGEFDTSALSLRDALVKEENGETLFAVPFSDDGSFAFMSVFCFGENLEIDGRDYLIFKIKNGNFI